MARELKIDRAIYAVDDRTRTYQFLRRNAQWRVLPPHVNARNKRAIEGYRRILRSGERRTFSLRSR